MPRKESDDPMLFEGVAPKRVTTPRPVDAGAITASQIDRIKQLRGLSATVTEYPLGNIKLLSRREATEIIAAYEQELLGKIKAEARG